MKTFDVVFITIFFNIGWFGSILLATTSFSEVSLIFPLVLGGYLYKKNFLSIKDFKYAVGILAVGMAFDFLAIYFGYILMNDKSLIVIPVWLISIWFLFSFSIVKIAAQLKLPLWLAAFLGGIMGPLSYKSGEFFKVLTFSSSKTFLIYAIFWAFMFPMIIKLSKRLI